MTYNNLTEAFELLQHLADGAIFTVFFGVFCLGAVRLGWWCGGEHW